MLMSQHAMPILSLPKIPTRLFLVLRPHSRLLPAHQNDSWAAFRPPESLGITKPLVMLGQLRKYWNEGKNGGWV